VTPRHAFYWHVDGFPFREWVWCLHCQRVYRRGAWELNHLWCPRPGCDGGPLHAVPWEALRAHKPDLPRKPPDGALYPL
jgi:hypothetical protein